MDSSRIRCSTSLWRGQYVAACPSAVFIGLRLTWLACHRTNNLGTAELAGFAVIAELCGSRTVADVFGSVRSHTLRREIDYVRVVGWAGVARGSARNRCIDMAHRRRYISHSVSSLLKSGAGEINGCSLHARDWSEITLGLILYL